MKCKEIICDICKRHVGKNGVRRLWMKKWSRDLDCGGMPCTSSSLKRVDICENCALVIANKVNSAVGKQEQNKEG